MHVCIHVLVREYTCMQVHTHVEARDEPQVFPLVILYFITETGAHLSD